MVGSEEILIGPCTAERGAVAREVKRIAAELGHELSNPIASAAANLRYVEEELMRLGGSEDLLAALRESSEALERVCRLVALLRVLPPDARGEGLRGLAGTSMIASREGP
jgi:hypothetical protein